MSIEKGLGIRSEIDGLLEIFVKAMEQACQTLYYTGSTNACAVSKATPNP